MAALQILDARYKIDVGYKIDARYGVSTINRRKVSRLYNFRREVSRLYELNSFLSQDFLFS